MSFWKNISQALRGDIMLPRSLYTLKVRSRRCQETINVEVNLRQELLAQYDNRGQLTGYYCRKLAEGSGANRCFDTVTIELYFDKKQQLLRREIENGVFL